MPVKVLLADDNDLMRRAISRVLKEEPRLDLVGEASSFAETISLISSLKPDLLLMDLHMRDEYSYPPDLVKSAVSESGACLIGISVWTDGKAKNLAQEFGARVLLDKAKLYSELLPAIVRFCPDKLA